MLKVSLPGSKSWINRFLIMSCFAKQSSSFTGGNSCDDVKHMVNALEQLGHRIDVHHDKTVITPGKWKGTDVYAGDAGTVGRFLTPICGWLGHVHLGMTPQLVARPMEEGLLSIRESGGEVSKQESGLQFDKPMQRGEFSVSPQATSQFLSGFLMLAAGIQGSVNLKADVPASAYVELTNKIINLFGVTLNQEGACYTFSGEVKGVEARSEPDLSGAAALLVALALVKRNALLEGWDASTVQAEGLLPEILTRSGLDLTLCDDGLRYCGGVLDRIVLNCIDVPDAVPALVALAATGTRVSEFSNYGYLSTKESNRTQRVMEMGEKAGIKFEFDGNILKVHPSIVKACELNGGDDHRMAMFALLLQLLEPQIKVTGEHSLSKSFPDFADKIQLIKSA